MKMNDKPHTYRILSSPSKTIEIFDWGHYKTRPEREKIFINIYKKVTRSKEWTKDGGFYLKRKVLIDLLEYLKRIHYTLGNIEPTTKVVDENGVEVQDKI